jgi:hypothetical protein
MTFGLFRTPPLAAFCSSCLGIILIVLTTGARAQNMPHEVGFWGAHQGQARLEAASEANRGFFQNVDIGHLYYSFVSNGVQSLAVFVESFGERRDREGVWTDINLGNLPVQYPARMSERIGLTIVGLETSRNVVTLGDLRFGGTLGIGYGFGGTDIDVTKLHTDSTAHYASAFDWQAFLLSFSLRVRYSVYITGSMDIGIVAGARYWGLPYLGPIATSTNYNGPDLRNSNNVGYIAGIAVGF